MVEHQSRPHNPNSSLQSPRNPPQHPHQAPLPNPPLFLQANREINPLVMEKVSQQTHPISLQSPSLPLHPLKRPEMLEMLEKTSLYILPHLRLHLRKGICPLLTLLLQIRSPWTRPRKKEPHFRCRSTEDMEANRLASWRNGQRRNIRSLRGAVR
jgi:hypothetical protein